MTNWADIVDTIRPTLFRISTPDGYGTGFLLHTSKYMISIATAHHVVQHAKDWEQPIRFTHHATGKSMIFNHADRAISSLKFRDLAVVSLPSDQFELGKQPFKLLAADQRIRQGIDLGWCGFPAVASNDLCFFKGPMSSFMKDEGCYLIDGVAINGVSGAPAFDEERRLCGVVTAYIPNTATGDMLPGVCLVQNIAPFHKRISELKSLEDAQIEADLEKTDNDSLD